MSRLLIYLFATSFLIGAGPASRPSANGARFPRIYPALPKPPYIDLGPVIYRHREGDRQQRTEDLLLLADRLHADVLVFEQRQLRQVYETGETSNYWTKQHYDDHTDLEVGYYRALRLGEDTPAKLITDPGLASSVLAARLNQEKTLGAQLQVLLGLYAQDHLNQQEFEVVRNFLVD